MAYIRKQETIHYICGILNYHLFNYCQLACTNFQFKIYTIGIDLLKETGTQCVLKTLIFSQWCFILTHRTFGIKYYSKNDIITCSYSSAATSPGYTTSLWLTHPINSACQYPQVNGKRATLLEVDVFWWHLGKSMINFSTDTRDSPKWK